MVREPQPLAGGPRPAPDRRRRADALVAAFALLLPTVITWLYFTALAGRPAAVQQGVYLVGKLVQFALPVVWVVGVQRAGVRLGRPARGGVGLGLAFGLLVLGATALGYYGWLRSAPAMAAAATAVRAKLAGFGVDRVMTFAALAVFYSAVHSLLEEYYWRWFVFGQLRAMMPAGAAVLVSSLGFASHHVLLLAAYFGWASPATWTFAAAVAVGGAVWAWLYDRTGSLLGPWLSHALADVGIFVVGFDFLRAGLA